MKLIKFFWLGVAISILPVQSLQAKVIKIATLAPAGTAWLNEMQTASKVIAEKTQGRVKFKFYPGGVMGNDATVLKKIRIGQLQGGAITSSSLVHIYPGLQNYSIPFLFDSYDEIRAVRKIMDNNVRQALAEKGYILLGIAEGGFARIFSDSPIASVEDLKKKKFWVPQNDVISQVSLEKAGTSPIPLPLSDVYTALQTGLVDTISANPTSVIAFQWHTKVKYMTDVPMLFIVGSMIVDKRAFNDVKAADKQIAMDEIDAAFKRLDKINYESDINALQALQKQGIQIIKPTTEEVAKWKAISGAALPELANRKVYVPDLLAEVLQKLGKTL